MNLTEADTPHLPDAHDWQPLPARSRTVFLIGSIPGLALPASAAGYFLAATTHWGSPWLGAASGLLIGFAVGAWWGLKQYRHTYWRLDACGLALRRGRLWQRETRVPTTRVQHLDLKRGPLQRRRNLATLVVHTAGTRNSAVTVPNLDAGDAELLRDRLARQIDHDDDA